MNIENRIEKLEGKLGVSQEPETLEVMLTKFNAGEYKTTTMSVVAFIRSGGSWDKLRGKLPGPLVDLFRDSMGKIQAATE